MDASIIFWRGCILFIGELPDLPPHAHLAAALVAGVDGEFEIRGRGLPDWTRCRTAWIPSGAEHEVRLGGARFASILTEPGSRTFSQLHVTESGWTFASGEPEEGDRLPILPAPRHGPMFLETVRSIDRADSMQDTNQQLRKLFPGHLTSATGGAEDRRLLRVAGRIAAAPQESPPLEDLAAEIGRSSSWLQHRFRARFGVPPRRYRTWFRLKATALLMKEGNSLASAAVGAGFYDQAHFTNAFREMFGIQPGIIFNRREPIRWFVDDEPVVRSHLAITRSAAQPPPA